MTEAEVKKNILNYGWHPWLKRPFYGFIMSTYRNGNTAKAFKKIGLPGWEYDFLINDEQWYQTDRNFLQAKTAVLKWLKTHSIKEITSRLEKSHEIWRQEVTELSQNPKKDTLLKLKKLKVILSEITTYMWATHVAEYYLLPSSKARLVNS